MANSPITLREMVFSIIQVDGQQPLKPTEIALQIVEKYKDYCAQKIQETSQDDFNVVKQIANQISASSKLWMSKYPQLKSSDETPRTYWWESLDADIVSEKPEPVSKIGEKNLYGLLCAYLDGMRPQKLYPKRINEGTSANTNGKKGNKHLHPDIVAMEDLMPSDSNVWSEKMRDWAKKAGAPQTKLWSFEVKIDLHSVSDAREGYLQALANSAWANYAYLVAKSISDKAYSELKVLHDLHGVGVILLNVENPIDSTVIKLPARERAHLDWGTCNRVASQNTDFRKFIELVADFHVIQKTQCSDWDIPSLTATDSQ